MIRIVVFFILLATLQSGNLKAQSSEYKKHRAIYEKALTFNDFSVATNALYNMLIIEPANTGLLDTLALMYFEQQKYVSSAIVAQDAAKKSPNNTLILEIAGTSFENIGLNDKALEHYELLYKANQDLSILYKISFLRYRLKRFDEANTAINKVIDNPQSNNIKLVFLKRDNSTRQEIPMIAAVYRLKGLLEYDKNNKEEALNMFNKALEYAPDFDIVLDTIDKLENE